MHKSCPAKIKAAGTDDGLLDGQFRAVVSVFGNVDSYGDVVMPGAFKDTLADWAASGDPIPVYWSHRMDDPDYNIGYVLEAQETDQGLEVLAQVDQGDNASSKAAQVYRLLKGRRVTQFSFAYDVEEQGQVEKDGEKFNELRRLKLHEVGPTPIGANPATELLAVKHDGDVLTRAVKALRDLADSGLPIPELLAALAPAKATQDGTPTSWVMPNTSTTASTSTTFTITTPAQASDSGPAKDEEPHGVKSEEPSRLRPSKDWDLLIRLTNLEGAS